jgi:16S rRNA (guanine527-N7)-methyltransferase
MSADDRLIEVLERSRALGFLGPGPVAEHLVHARRFEALLGPGASLLDLGSGGGVPGLVLCGDLPYLSAVLLDARQGRVDALVRAIARLGASDRCRAVCGQAEILGRQPEFRHQFDVVVARSFGQLSWTLECSAAFVTVPGRIVISAPPEPPAVDLAPLGLVPVESPDAGFLVYAAVDVCIDTVPRRSVRPR